jgi:hypothetical protein
MTGGDQSEGQESKDREGKKQQHQSREWMKFMWRQNPSEHKEDSWI